MKKTIIKVSVAVITTLILSILVYILWGERTNRVINKDYCGDMPYICETLINDYPDMGILYVEKNVSGITMLGFMGALIGGFIALLVFRSNASNVGKNYLLSWRWGVTAFSVGAIAFYWFTTRVLGYFLYLL